MILTKLYLVLCMLGFLYVTHHLALMLCCCLIVELALGVLPVTASLSIGTVVQMY